MPHNLKGVGYQPHFISCKRLKKVAVNVVTIEEITDEDEDWVLLDTNATQTKPSTSVCNQLQSSTPNLAQVQPEADDLEIQIQPAPPRLEDGTEATVDDLKEINLGSPEDPKPVFVSALMPDEEMQAYHR